jgi:hypothetical protein
MHTPFHAASGHVRRARLEAFAHLVALAILSLPLAGGCAGQTGNAETIDSQTSSPELTQNTVVVAWSQIAFDAALSHDKFQDFAVNLRGITMMHLALHDALNSIRPRYERYAFTGALEPSAHPTAAAAQAAHDVLVSTYPAQRAALGAELELALSRLPDGHAKDLGIELGKKAAATIISERKSDGWDATGTYAPDPKPKPGDYQFVPPLELVFRPDFADAKPFGIDDGAQFRAPPPPALSSPEYARAYGEVKALGAASGSARSEDQSHEARWWYEYAEIGWNRSANLLARQTKLELYPAARMFALMNMGIADAYLAVWNAKRFYHSWRPYTAIRAGDTDGNDATDLDRAWQPFCVTPPVWEYPSAHAMQSAAAAEMLASSLGSDSVSLTVKSTTAPPERPERSFTSLRGAAAEAADSRVMCGIHFRFATDAGLVQGRALALAILAARLRSDQPGQ